MKIINPIHDKHSKFFAATSQLLHLLNPIHAKGAFLPVRFSCPKLAS